MLRIALRVRLRATPFAQDDTYMHPRPCHPEWREAESNFFVRDPKRCYAPFDPRYARISTAFSPCHSERAKRVELHSSTERSDGGISGRTSLRMTRTKKAPSNAKAGSRAKRSFMYYVYILTNKTDTVMYPPQKKKGLTYDIPI